MKIKITTPESERIESEITLELKEAAFFLGGWDKLRELIKQIEDNDNEAAYERAQTGDAWSGGIADNH
jgi:hypothetical protein